ncbi:DNA-binding protein [Cryobacterium sp. MDB1-18-2]|uniref:helix-turn-helix domain-containing protein n=1 Tax=unclassified Cryobacterium TaxID=2649013 RepID=UPI001069FDB2|nr:MULTISPECIES: helix-turn-helix domain-containing protein [unclassified Cryobacterium]TFC32900.1 DNA-binding protein [Cryobacterium sp. MDB1-18-2]TFC44643.1 DNA-binding protein [Cryobacterium sp. MDB1-18-1]
MAFSLANYIDLPAAVEQSGYGFSTLRRHIKAGHIPAVKIKGRVYVTPEDLDAFVAPEPMITADATLKDWAERMAAKAPAFRPEQRDVIVSAFTSALAGA